MRLPAAREIGNMAHGEYGPKLSRAADVLVRDLMCVKPGESLLIAADTGTDRAAVEALQDSGYRLGAKVASLILAPQLPFQGALADEYMPAHVRAAIDACDVCIDLCFPYLAGSKAYDHAMHNNRTRYFLGADVGTEELIRLMGKVDLDTLLEVGDVFGAYVQQHTGKECRITTREGTDVTFTLAKPDGLGLAKATKPGGYFMPGTVLLLPELKSVEGTIVVRHFFHEYYTESSEPVTLKIKGKVQEILGGGSEHKVMRRSIARAGNGDYGYVVHFTCGIHPAARLTGKSFMEDQRVMGSNAVGLGLPPWEPGGGENHPDIVFTMQSIWIDGQPIVKDGVVVGPPHLREAMQKLQPVFT
jgi:leucyl aminopeptidase (aminopeptidase T)